MSVPNLMNKNNEVKRRTQSHVAQWWGVKFIQPSSSSNTNNIAHIFCMYKFSALIVGLKYVSVLVFGIVWWVYIPYINLQFTSFIILFSVVLGIKQIGILKNGGCHFLFGRR